MSTIEKILDDAIKEATEAKAIAQVLTAGMNEDADQIADLGEEALKHLSTECTDAKTHVMLGFALGIVIQCIDAFYTTSCKNNISSRHTRHAIISAVVDILERTAKQSGEQEKFDA